MSYGDSFPCIICGKPLERVSEHGSEAQPSGGIMCETGGNYGSAVWDSEDGERLAFSICDPCMVEAGERGRVWTYREFRLILASRRRLVIGREELRGRPYIPWHEGLAADDEAITMDADEAECMIAENPARYTPLPPPMVTFTISPEEIRKIAGS